MNMPNEYADGCLLTDAFLTTLYTIIIHHYYTPLLYTIIIHHCRRLVSTHWYQHNAPRLLAGKAGKKPLFSDSEVMTLSLAQHWRGINEEREFLRFVKNNHLPLFPRRIDQSQFNQSQFNQSQFKN